MDVAAVSQDADTSSAFNTAITTLRENIMFTRGAVLSSPGGAVGGYLHNNGTFGALVGAVGAPASPELQALLAKVAQHTVAVDPGSLLCFCLR